MIYEIAGLKVEMEPRFGRVIQKLTCQNHSAKV